MHIKEKRVIKYILMIVILVAITGGYFYFQTRGATKINSSQDIKSTDGLVGYWTFDGNHMDWTATDEAIDQAGSNDGDVVGATASMGKVGQSLDFNGVNDYVTVNGFQPSGSFTLSMWVKLGSQTAGESWWRPIITNQDVDGTGLLISANRGDSTGRVQVQFDFDNGNSTETIGTYGLDTWAHVAFTWNGSGAYRYSNGVQSVYSVAGGTDNVAQQDLYIGASQDLSISRFFNGSIDEVRIYDRALSQGEITELYSQGQAKMGASQDIKLTDGLMGNWTFDGNHMDWPASTAEAVDQSGANQCSSSPCHGNVVDAAATIGRIGQALDFNGTDYVEMSSDTFDFDRTTPFSFSVWRKRPDIGGFSFIFGNFRDSIPRGLFLGEAPSLGRTMQLILSNNDGESISMYSTDTVPDAGKFYLLTYTYNGSGAASGVKMYVDGALQSTSTSSDNLSSSTSHSNSIRMGRTTASAGYQLSGVLDEARLYDRVLSVTEIAELYNQGQATTNASKETIMADSLVGNWTFDGNHMDWGATDEVIDQSGSNDGDTVNMDSSDAAIGKVGQALDFDGSTEYVDVGDIDITDQITASAWINFRSFTGIFQGIISKTYPTSWFFGMYNNTRNLSVYMNGTSIAYTTGDLINFDQWHHVAFTYNKDAGGTDEVKIYIDGSESATGDYDTAIGTDDDGVEIGRNETQYFDGKIDEVRLYDRALNSREIEQLYKVGR